MVVGEGIKWVRIMSEKTLFQKICDREIPAELLYEDGHCVAFRDISPQSPQHVLIVPRKPIPRLGMAEPEDAALLGHLMLTAGKVAEVLGISDSGFRVVINHGRDAGETVPHLHVHLLGGRAMHWPPG